MTKAKKEASSTAPSPAASAPSPLPHPSPVGGSFVPLSRSGSSKGPLPPPTFSAPSPAASTHSTGTAAPRKMTAKNRKQLLSEQLPLQPGRKIAYRQTGKPAPGEPKTEEWILAEILECLDPEKNKCARRPHRRGDPMSADVLTWFQGTAYWMWTTSPNLAEIWMEGACPLPSIFLYFGRLR